MKISEISAGKAAEEEAHLKKIAAALEQDCRPYLSAINRDLNQFALWRGNARDSGFQKINVRLDDRRPLTATRKEHYAMNDYFIKKFGQPFRDAMFCTGNSNEAEEYGNLHCVFPIGNFKFVWSPKMRDSYIDMPSITTNYCRGDGKGTEICTTSDTSFGRFLMAPDMFMELSQYQDTDLMGAIKSGHEIMIRCKQAYMISIGEYYKVAMMIS